MPGGKGNIKHEDGVPFSSENQPANRGRKKGSRAWKDVLSDMMPEDGYLTFTNIQVVNEDGKVTGDVIARGRVKMTTQDMITLALIKKAMKGDTRAAQLIMDRMDGKAKQSVDVNGGGTITFTPIPKIQEEE